MGMLHPMFNHLGRSNKKPLKKSKEQETAERRHEAFLLRHGVKPGRHRLKGVTPLQHRVNDQ